MSQPIEKRALQGVLMLAACVPVAAGVAGIVGGLPDGSAARDSHYRYLSGLLLGLGLLFWSTVPAVERRTGLIRALTLVVFIGGLARLYALVVRGDPGSMKWALVMELLVAPAVCLWQARVAARSAAQSLS